MREIVLDTETTGFDPKDGHRLIEIGCLELHHYVPTGVTFHQYLNPERDVPADAVAVHGLTTEFLTDKPLMAEVVEKFLDFIADTTLVIHNAEFDLKFLNAELKRLGFPALQNPVIDTVHMARQKYPGQPANLDALCRRFKIDHTNRTLHGALLDAGLLAEVYLEMRGGRQQGLALKEDDASLRAEQRSVTSKTTYRTHHARLSVVSDLERAAHENLVAALGEGAIWKKYKS